MNPCSKNFSFFFDIPCLAERTSLLLQGPWILWLSSDNSSLINNAIVKTFTKRKPNISIISSCVWNCTFKLRFEDNSYTNYVKRELNFDLKRNVPRSSVGSPPPALPVSLRALTHFTRIFPRIIQYPGPAKYAKPSSYSTHRAVCVVWIHSPVPQTGS